MTTLAQKLPADATGATTAGPAPHAEAAGGRVLDIVRVPQITIHAFSETPELTADLERAVADRRMSRAHATLHPGGIATAVELYRRAPTPNLLIVESPVEIGELHAQLDALADVCDASTKVIVIGRTNDIALYRDLLQRGISEYLVAPFDPVALIGVIARLYQDAGTSRLGRSFAFIAAKGGVGSSTIAHNFASTLARAYGSEVILADLDLPFGSAGLGFNVIDQSQGMAEAVQDAGRLDSMLLERLLIKHEDRLSLLPAPASLEQFHDLKEGAFEPVLEVAQSNVPFVVLDIPHVWTAWTKKTLLTADEVVIVAAPDLANLRNAKNLVALLKKARPNDGPPKLVLNQVGVPKREEIERGKFAAALQIEPIACIPFEPMLFSRAANEGQMIADVAPRSNIAKTFVKIVQTVTGRARTEDGAKSRSFLDRLLRS